MGNNAVRVVVSAATRGSLALSVDVIRCTWPWAALSGSSQVTNTDLQLYRYRGRYLYSSATIAIATLHASIEIHMHEYLLL